MTNYNDFESKKKIAFAENKELVAKKTALIVHDVFVALVNFIKGMINQVLGK